ncbi:hypothetical protein FXF61_04750 [Pseudomonas sp. C27(2019)]|uniref:hypothetical protein n=1 Tax=Pseudomonas sp. C27(2019) TaxID=2604941 RepID=UPI0012445E42|nr:hypothetical protein [Pseudomonas sp. C27(2019)]QEY58514.1 hypothetical protein FXF61_04750 [Pseudomonas sp. C27(2019)]
MQYFEIAFCGEILPGAELNQVKMAIAGLFKADEALLARLFSGQRMIIKQRLDAQAAAKYQTAFQRAGAVLEVREINEPKDDSSAVNAAVTAESAEPQQEPTAQSAAPAATAMLQVAPRDEYMAAFIDVQAPDFGIAPLGDDLQPTPMQKPAPELDLSGISLAPAGSDMGQLPGAQALPVPDISHIKLADED